MKPENPPQNSNRPDKPDNDFYFLDGKKVETSNSSVAGASIRAQLPPEKAGYAIYLEGHGNDPDKLVSDTDFFALDKTGKLRFYSVPAADFGCA